MYIFDVLKINSFPGKTLIFGSHIQQTVNAMEDATFRCNVSVDPAEKSKLKIDWQKNGKRMDFVRDGRISKTADNSLKITQAHVTDTAEYTCNASTSLDWHTLSAKLIVKGRVMRLHALPLSSSSLCMFFFKFADLLILHQPLGYVWDGWFLLLSSGPLMHSIQIGMELAQLHINYIELVAILILFARQSRPY